MVCTEKLTKQKAARWGSLQYAERLRLVLQLNGTHDVKYGNYQTGQNGNNLNAHTAGSEQNVRDKAENRTNDTENHQGLCCSGIVPVLLALDARDDLNYQAHC